MFGASLEQLQAVVRHFATENAVLYNILESKGILTQEEVEQVRARVTPACDQEFARIREEKMAEIEREEPGLALVMKLFGDR